MYKLRNQHKVISIHMKNKQTRAAQRYQELEKLERATT
jgi:hypothetical protein